MDQLYVAISLLAEPAIWFVFGLAIVCCILMVKNLKPIIKELERELDNDLLENRKNPSHRFLSRAESKYKRLIEKTDEVSAGDFSLGEVQGWRLPIMNKSVQAEKIQSFIKQAPALLISLGLLGTFAGLTGGLSEIQTVLQPNISPTETASKLAQVISPMSLAFRTSLLGLVLSISLSILYQLTGWKNILDRCEALLTGWLETVIPIRLGEQLKSPLRVSIDTLNTTSKSLPAEIGTQVKESMDLAFKTKLDQFFDLYVNLAADTKRAVSALSILSSAFQESSGDFLTAAETFNRSNFAIDLQEAVSGLEQSKQSIIEYGERLGERFSSLREDLGIIQSDWQIITKLTADQLRLSSALNETTKKQQLSIADLMKINTEGVDGLATSIKELRQVRLDVGKDRKSLQSTAASISARLEAGAELSRSYKLFTESLADVLSNWKSSTIQMGQLYSELIEQSRRNYSGMTNESQALIKGYRHSSQELIEGMQNILSEFDVAKTELQNQIRIQSETIMQMKEVNLANQKDDEAQF